MDRGNDESLFEQKSGFDSLDAAELVILTNKHYVFQIKDIDEGMIVFALVNTLTDSISKQRDSSTD